MDLKSGNQLIIQGMHTYPLPDVSMQTTKMELCSGGKDLTVTSLIFMIMLQGTFLLHVKTLGMPLDSDHVGEASQNAGRMEEKATALCEEEKWRISLPTNNFGMYNVKETISNKESTTIDASGVLSMLSCVDPYLRSQLLVEYSKDLHTGMILDGMKQGGGYLVHEGVIYHLGKVFLSQASKLKQEILQRAHKEFLSSYMQSAKIYSLIMRSFDWEGMKEELHQHYEWEELHQHLQECNIYEEMGQRKDSMQEIFQPSLPSLKRGGMPMPNSMCVGDLHGK